MSDHGTDISASDLLALEQVGDSLFRSTKNLHNLTGPIFGGQLLGQAVHACRLTVEQWPVHSCAGFFLSRTIVEEPLDFAQCGLARQSVQVEPATRRIGASLHLP